MTEPYTIPPSLYVLCAMSAMAFIIGTYRWLWGYARGTHRRSLNVELYWSQLLNFIFVVILSIAIGLYDSFPHLQETTIKSEIVLLTLIFTAIFLLSKQFEKIPSAIRSFVEMILFGILCLGGWALTGVIGYLCWETLNVISILPIEINVILSFFIPGILWNVPVIILYTKIKKETKGTRSVNVPSLSQVLLPVFLAYVILLFPLTVHKVVNSDEWKKIQNAKPLKKA